MSEVRVQFLGSGDAFGGGGRLQTCISVEAASARFVIDCGATALAAMKRYGVEPSRIESILITHLHGDHFGGLPFFFLEARFSKRTRPLLLAGPPGLQERTQQVFSMFFPGSAQNAPAFPIEYLSFEDRVRVAAGPLAVTPLQVVHGSGAPAFALRVACEGKVIAYSGDTGWTPALIEAACGADLFICEAYTFDQKIKFHLDFETLRSHRAQLACRRLVLTHMSEDMLKRLGTLDAEWAEDGKTILL